MLDPGLKKFLHTGMSPDTLLDRLTWHKGDADYNGPTDVNGARPTSSGAPPTP